MRSLVPHLHFIYIAACILETVMMQIVKMGMFTFEHPQVANVGG